MEYYRWFEIGAFVIIVLCTVNGWERGLLLNIYGLIRFTVMVVLTIILTPIIYSILTLEPGVREFTSLISALIIANILLHVVSHVLHIVDKIPVISTINRVGGAALGAVLGVLSIWVILVVISTFPENEWCANVMSYISQSPILSFLASLKPNILSK